MQVKEIKPINFLFARIETTVMELANHLPVSQQIFKAAVEKGLTITGPMHWHYFGFTDLQKSFTLEISLPVSHVLSDYDGEFHFKRTEPFRCVSLVHEGPWLQIPESYGKLMEFINVNKLLPTGNNREVYTNVDFQYTEANVTEIQMGIQ